MRRTPTPSANYVVKKSSCVQFGAADGYEVAKRLRRDPDLSHVLLIAISGYWQNEDRQRSRAAGFDHHLAKPTDHRELLALLSESRDAATEVS